MEGIIRGMDVGGRGRVGVEDIVRWVNLEADGYWRNRDLVLVYGRLGGDGDGVRVGDVLGVFCE